MLNPNAPIPLYRQLADLLTESIRAGTYPPGSRIPSEPKLVAEHGLGRPTVRQAIDLLVRRGLLVRRRGSGTYVCDLQKEVDLFSLDGTGASFAKTGVHVETLILSPMALCPVEVQADNPFSGQHAYTFRRLTCVTGVPVLLEDLYLHARLFSGIDQMAIEGRSLSAIAEEKYYLRPVGGKQSFCIGYPDDRKAGHLHVSPKTPLLTVKRWLNFPQTDNGVYARLWCRTDQFVFSQTIGGSGYA
jgi:GntR family transcriptional regulator